MTEPLTVIDTFSGIGGFSYAAEKLVGGFKTVAFVECEPYCQKVLKKHWPDVPIYDDIKAYNPEPYSADVVCGGFPCQSISNAGKREGITETSQSGLWYELHRVICLLQPRYIVLENVSAILSNGLGIVLGNLAEAGYCCEWCCIPASYVGACHQRDRWWLIAYPMRKGLQGLRGKHELQKSSRERTFTWRNGGITLEQDWKRYISKPTICRGDDGVPNWIYRNSRIKALGNSIVPQVAVIPLQRVKELSSLQIVTTHTH